VTQWLRCCATNPKVACSIPAGVIGILGDHGDIVVKVLCYKLEGHWFDPSCYHWNFSLTKSFRSQYGHGVDSVSNRNGHQDHFLGVKATGA